MTVWPSSRTTEAVAASGDVMVKLLMPNDCSFKERCSSAMQKGLSDVDGEADRSLCLSVSGDSVALLEQQQILTKSRKVIAYSGGLRWKLQRGASHCPTPRENVEGLFEYWWKREIKTVEGHVKLYILGVFRER